MNLSELRTALQDRREDYSQSKAKLNRRINQAYLDMCSRRKWGWLRREYSAITTAPNTQFTQVPFVQGDHEVDILSGAAALTRTPPTVFGTSLLVNGAVYKVVWVGDLTGGVGTESQIIKIEPPFQGATGNYDITILHNELALPKGASGVEAVSFTSANSEQPLSMVALSTAQMMYRDAGEQGQPSQFAVSKKDLISRPLTAIPPASITLVGGGDATQTAPRPYTVPATNPRYYAYTYVNNQTGAESVLSPPTASVDTSAAGAGSQVEIVFQKADLTVKEDFTINLYSTTAGGDANTFYFVNDSGGLTDPTFSLQNNASDQYLLESGKYRAPDSGGILSLRFFPTPNDIYKVTAVYSVSARAMGEDADVPVFNADFHQVILDGAEALMLEASDEQRRANQARGRYEQGIARMIQLDRLNAQQRVVIGGKRRITGRLTAWNNSFPNWGPSGPGWPYPP